MAHIVEFNIDGLAGRTEPVAAKLNRDVNVFYGPNGTGKTSLLRILESAMRRDASVLAYVPFERAEVVIHSVDFGRQFTYRVDKSSSKAASRAPVPAVAVTETTEPAALFQQYVVGQLEKAPQLEWKVSPKLSAGSSGVWKHSWLPTTRLYVGRRGVGRHVVLEQTDLAADRELDEQFGLAVKNLWSSYSAEVLSRVRSAQEEGLANILRAVLTPPRRGRRRTPRVDTHTAYTRISAFMERQGSPGIMGTEGEFTRRYARDRSLAAVAEDIDLIEAKIDVATAPRRRLEDLIKRMFSGPKTIKFSDTAIQVMDARGQDIGLPALSSGEKHVLRVFAEVLLGSGSTVLVDEPEISLHIDWQRSLVKSLTLLDPQCQFILATHSPEIMAELEDKFIFRL